MNPQPDTMCLVFWHIYNPCGHREYAFTDSTRYPKRYRIRGREGMWRCYIFNHILTPPKTGRCPTCLTDQLDQGNFAIDRVSTLDGHAESERTDIGWSGNDTANNYHDTRGNALLRMTTWRKLKIKKSESARYDKLEQCESFTSYELTG